MLHTFLTKILCILLFNDYFNVFSQNLEEVNILLKEISKTNDSHKIAETKAGKKLINYGWKITPLLSDFFYLMKLLMCIQSA